MAKTDGEKLIEIDAIIDLEINRIEVEEAKFLIEEGPMPDERDMAVADALRYLRLQKDNL